MCVCVCVDLCVHVCVHVRMCTCTCVYMYMCVCCVHLQYSRYADNNNYCFYLLVTHGINELNTLLCLFAFMVHIHTCMPEHTLR